MFHNKSIFAATLSDQFRISAKWRTAQAKRYSYDARNATAAQRLLELDAEIDIPDHAWEQIQPLVSDPACLAVVSETMRDVAFRKHPASFVEWLEIFRANLTRSQSVDA